MKFAVAKLLFKMNSFLRITCDKNYNKNEHMKSTLQRALVVSMLVPVLFSCATYNKSMNCYYANLQAHNYEKAMRSIENNKLIKKDRNALLYHLEMGKLYRLQNDFANSNMHLNRADNLIENNKKTLADVALGNLINPMRQAYRGEDHEQFMMHFYKALNYAALGKTEDAVVEARRITLSSIAQGDKFSNKENRYSKDAFALNLQGMIYEMAGDVNNAFIAYRNASEIYVKANNDYYGVKMPEQLRQDVLRTAAAMGFSSEQLPYEKAFNVSYNTTTAENGELILFLEEGQAPVKEEKTFFLTASNNGINSFSYTDANGNNANYNFNASHYSIAEDKITSLRTFKLALPTYSVQYLQPQNIVITNNEITYTPELAQNINSIAVNVLRERFLAEMGKALARQITKKLLEKGTEAAAEGIARSTDKREAKDTTAAEKEKTEKKKEDRINRAGEIAGLAMNIFNTINEKADTRNWQSLPAFVSYVRIPLHMGENTITITSNGSTKNIKVDGRSGLQMMGLSID
jgi:uncharacterized protein